MSQVTRGSIVLALSAATAFACGAATGDSGKETKGSKKSPAAAAGLAPASTVAVVGDRTISLQELDAQAAGNLVQVRQQEYEIRKQALDNLLNEQLLGKEAEAKGLSREALLKAEVTDKVTDPPQAEIDEYYEKNKARFGAQTKEQAAPQITTMLRSQKLMEGQRNYMKSLRQKHGVKVMLEPPRVEVALDDDPSKGPAKAPVTIVEFSDYQCPYCSRAESVVEEVLKKYGDKVRLVYRDYPLKFHQNAETASQGAECAEEQGKFWEMHKALFANQQKLAATDLAETAGGLGMDKEKFKACLDSGKYKAEVQKDFEDGQKYGVSGTPTFFINGIPMVGARGVDAFAEIIDAELERAN
ncbi:MAG: thioredoxin domain-containing protein [Acidobacteria bacterium]|nr:thioredoxin domain-containing protein [Acidobacteriota bacterium]